MSFSACLAQHPITWGLSIFLAGVWLSRVVLVGLNLDKIPEISGPDYESRIGVGRKTFGRIRIVRK